MNHTMIAFRVLVLCISLLLTSCMTLNNPANKVDYYTLEYDSSPPEGLPPLDEVIQVLRFSVAAPYNMTRIVYRDDVFRRKSYDYHKWRANPGDLATYCLARDMRNSGLFRAVLTNDSKMPSSYMLEGSVDECLEWDAEPSWRAVLALTVTLMAENDPDIHRRILSQKTYREEELCTRKNPAALAEAMSRAMARISTRIIRDIHRSMSR